ncbi:MAG TPA: choice-of-anchor I family protein, partial [Chroococcidiopsis sp.]
KPHSEAGNGLDASDKDDAIAIATYDNLFGMYQPDAIAAYNVNGRTYLVTANEGDSRDYDGFGEEARVADLALDPAAFPDAAALQADTALGRLTVTQTLGDANGDGQYEQLYVLGGRSFSIWDESGNLVFDSGDAFERILAQTLPNSFNANNTENNSDNRSDNKGPEPEGLALAQVGDRTYALIGLERIGGVMVYDITNPTAPSFISYANRRDFALPFDEDTFSATNEDGDPVPSAEQLLAVGDLGPEGLLYIAAEDSPIDSALLVVANEVSGTTTIYAIAP